MGDTISKDFLIEENWNVAIEEIKKTPSLYEHKYTLTINEEDI